MNARERIDYLFDDHSFVEVGGYVSARNTDYNLGAKKVEGDGVITGYGVINDRMVYVYSQDASALGGSVGEMHAKKIASLYDLAMKTGAPIIGMLDCAGLRLQEATDALHAFGTIFNKQAQASGMIPQISAVFGMCGGGSAVMSAMSDFTLMEKENGSLFINSPNALAGNEESRQNTAGAQFQSEQAGNVDFVCETEEALLDQLRILVDVLPSDYEAEDVYFDNDDDLNRVIPDFTLNWIGLMENLNAVITGVGGYVPDYVLTNDEISKMVDTNDEWIMGRIGIKERRILHEEGLGTSYMARKAVKQLMQRTKTSPNDIDLVIVATTTPDYHFPSTASILCDKLGLNNAFAFDMQAVCSGFLYAMEAGANFIRSGKYKKVVIVGADKMSSVIDYTDRTTCPIFGDGAAAFMLEPTREDMGVMDAVLRTDGKGLPFLHIKAGGSVCAPSYYTLDNRMHYIYQEGRTVFKYAVANMADACEAVMERNHLAKEDIDWVIPHQANMRIITAVSQRLGVSPEKVMVNIERYGNTSAGTLPLCVWDFEDKLKKGDKLIFTAFGAGFAWGAIYVKWGYDGKG